MLVCQEGKNDKGLSTDVFVGPNVCGSTDEHQSVLSHNSFNRFFQEVDSGISGKTFNAENTIGAM